MQLLPKLYSGDVHPAPYIRVAPVFLGIPISKPVVKQKAPEQPVVTPAVAEAQLTWFDSAYLAALLNEIIYDVVRSEIEIISKVYVDQKQKASALLERIYEELILAPEIKELVTQYTWQEFHRRSKDGDNLKINKTQYNPNGPKLDSHAWDTLSKLEPDYVRNKPAVLAVLAKYQPTNWNQLLGPKQKVLAPPLPNSNFVASNMQSRLAATVAGPTVADYSLDIMEDELNDIDAQDRLRNPPRYL